MEFHYSLYFLPLTATALLCTLVTLPTWRRRHMPGGRPLLWILIALAIWSIGNVLELGNSELPIKLLWVRIEYLGIVTVPLAWLTLAMEYAGLQRWLARRYLTLLAVVPLATLVVVWTSNRHGLYYRNIGLDASGPYTVITKTYGPWFWAWVGYSYLLLLAGSILLIRTAVRQRGPYRSQAVAMLVAALLPWLGNLLYITGLSPLSRVDLTPIAFGLSTLVLAWALFRYHLLDLAPVARDAVFAHMSDAVLVLDAAHRLVDLNPAAERVIQWPASEAIGQRMERLLANWPALAECCSQTTDGHCEVELGEGKNRRTYDVRISSLRVQGPQPQGRLVVMRDVTENKRAQEEIHRRAEELSALYEITRDLGAGQELPELLQSVAQRAAELLGATGAGIYLYDPEHRELEIAVRYGAAVKPGVRLRLDEGMAGRVAQTRQPLIVDDYSTWPGRAAIYDDIPFRAVVEVPMLYGGELVGVLVVHEIGDSTRTFSESDAQLLSLFASQAASAVYNARLFTTPGCWPRPANICARLPCSAASSP